jgi:transposase
MFNLDDNCHYYLYPGYVSMGKGIESLTKLAFSIPRTNVLEGDAYLFVGIKKNTLKILRWDKNGFILYQKQLQTGTFQIPRFHPERGWNKIDRLHFFLMMEGVSVSSIKSRRWFHI